jgi:hypothetical protein
MAHLRKNFIAPALPLPSAEYRQQEATELSRALRLYFTQLDQYINNLTEEVNNFMAPFSATSLDAFGRLRVAQPFTLFDSQNRYDADDQFDTAVSGTASATVNSNESTVDLLVDTASGDEVVRQSFRTMHYQPGKSLMFMATFVMEEAKDNLRQRVGYFNADNGVFFQQNDAILSFVIRTATSGTPSDARIVNQADWNGDRLNGQGPSGITLNVTKAQIFFMDFEWLGVGSVRCGFVIDGVFIVCHTFNNANDFDKVYMTTAILPVRYEITNTGTTASPSTLKQVCSTVISEGGFEESVADSVARQTTLLTSITTTFLPLVSIRLKSTRLGAVVLPRNVNVFPVANGNYEIALIKNATLTSASYDGTAFPNVEFDVSATAMSGGTIVQTDYVASTNQARTPLNAPGEYNLDLQLGVSLAGVSDVYTVAVRLISGSGGSAVGAISFSDLTD